MVLAAIREVKRKERLKSVKIPTWNPHPDQPTWTRGQIQTFLEQKWQTKVLWHRSQNKRINEMRTLKDKCKFVIVLPAATSASWWGDVIERVVDLPIPIPASKPKLDMTFALGTSKYSGMVSKDW